MKILFIDSNHPILHQTLEAAGHTCDLKYDWTREQILDSLEQYDGIVIRSRIKIDRQFIDHGKNLRFIARAGAGMENIDLVYAREKRILCLHAAEGNRDAVAEHALGMLLSLVNNLFRADRQVREGTWIREGNRGVELGGKTVGIIGYGNTGTAFAERLRGFGVKILAYDKYRSGFGNAEIREASMSQIFDEADVLSLHIPLTEETNYLADKNFLEKFKKNIYLINTSRGKIVRTADLVKALSTGKVVGACLDVLEYEMSSFENLQFEELPSDFQFLTQSDRVVLSPHIAGWTIESNEKIASVLAYKIIQSFK